MTQKQFVVLSDPELRDSQFAGEVALVNEDGTPWSPGADAAPVSWSDVTGKPSQFMPATHTHTISDVTGLQDALDAMQASIDGMEGGGA